eukprot:CAMPEP_0196733418 /NCGR_PEP_ID=MMETSP1091-20130531/12484_1 /TAXON_ID=302021 /ORGANISM="Rhodomonas sp., Strain CCMP768" /LENGTH=107 /DNA_ID=CAMNT_0042076789 /DNA_START=372 /DNA_END=695 /DNA_ORIENTATION=-
MTQCPFSDDNEELKVKRESFGAGPLKIWMQRLADCAEESSTDWIASTEDITIADLVVWQLLTMIRTNDFSFIPGDYSDTWPKLVKLEQTVPAHAVVKAWQAHRASKQ